MSMEQQPNNDWVEKRAKFHESQGMDRDVAYEKALEESKEKGEEIAGMYSDPQTGEVMKEETRKKIEEERRKKGAKKEQPGTIH